jgi:hypothetical protein
MPTSKSRGATLNSFQMTENNNLVITSAKSLGLSVVNIGATDLNEGREHLILGLIWQVIRKGLLGKIDIKQHPELYRLLEEDETLEQFLRLPPDQILLRWFNYHLKAANWGRRCVPLFFFFFLSLTHERDVADKERGTASPTSRRTSRMGRTTPFSLTSSSRRSVRGRRCRSGTCISERRRCASRSPSFRTN